ncbi:hypothetical protein LBMAG56_46040 [Verrucomicrobiota bacterium]|nr:hypothetical protein LBMAG56_46040 [Verrucomicrobiota bacterium]
MKLSFFPLGFLLVVGSHSVGDAATAVATTAPAVSLAGDFGEPRVIVPASADPALAHHSWPKVVRAKDGTLVVAFVAERFHGFHGEGCPAVAISTNNGATFGAPTVLKRFTAKSEYTSAGNVALGLADDGAVVLLAMAYRGNAANTVDGWRSTDGGRTWAAADTATLDRNQTGSVFGGVPAVPGKGLAVFGHFRQGSLPQSQGLWLAWSEDGGKSWGKPRAFSEQGLFEPAFVFSGGRFIGLVRTKDTADHYVQFTSADFGASWQVTERGLTSEHAGPVSLPSPCLVTDPEQPGRLYALVSERFTDKTPGGLLGRVVLWTADAKELRWQRRGEVVRFPRTLGARRDITYAWMTPLGGGEWFAVFYCGLVHGPADIYGMKLRSAEGP